MNKRAIEMLNFPMWTLRIIFLAILIISIGLVINKYINIQINIAPIESTILMQRILYSNSIMHQDKTTFRTYPTIIEQDKTKTDTALNEDINFGNTKHTSAQVQIGQKKIYLNKRTYEDLKPQLGTLGSDIQQTTQTYPAFIYSNEKSTPDKLTIEVLQQR